MIFLPFYLHNIQKVIIFVLSNKKSYLIDWQGLNAREETTKRKLEFFSLYWEALQNEEAYSKKEFEDLINESLDELIEIKKLKEQ